MRSRCRYPERHARLCGSSRGHSLSPSLNQKDRPERPASSYLCTHSFPRRHDSIPSPSPRAQGLGPTRGGHDLVIRRTLSAARRCTVHRGTPRSAHASRPFGLGQAFESAFSLGDLPVEFWGDKGFWGCGPRSTCRREEPAIRSRWLRGADLSPSL